MDHSTTTELSFIWRVDCTKKLTFVRESSSSPETFMGAEQGIGSKQGTPSPPETFADANHGISSPPDTFVISQYWGKGNVPLIMSLMVIVVSIP